jgi:hypothetical protein
MIQRNIYLEKRHIDYLQSHRELNLSGWIRQEIDKKIGINEIGISLRAIRRGKDGKH